MSAKTPAITNAPQAATSVPKANAPAPARHTLTPVHTALLQRACACGQLPGSGGKCDECDKKNKKNVLQRASSGGPQPASIPSGVNQVLSSPGRPLDGSTRTFMESRFGHDFSHVRIHNDSLAAESAHAVNARAYTVGQDIVFNRAEYQPHTTQGRRLLAHELAHTIQQGDRPQLQSKMEIDPPGSQTEREADQIAQRVMAGGEVSVYQQASTGAFQREALEPECLADISDPSTVAAAYDPSKRDPKESVPGFRAHDVITQDYKSQIGDAKKTKGLAIPGASSAALKSGEESGKGDKVIPSALPPPMDEKSRKGEGRPDLVYRGEKAIELAEIKIATPVHVPLAELQVENYKKYANENPEWLEMRGFPDFKLMQKDRYKPTSPIDVDGKKVKVTWCSPGVIVYKVIAPAKAEGEKEASDTEPYEIKMGALQATLQVPKGAVAKKGDTVPISDSDPAARMISGLILVKLDRKPSGDDIIEAAIETAGDSKESKALPIEISGTKEVIQVSVNKKTRELTKKKSKKTSIPFGYKPMSLGAITETSISQTEGLSGKGYIKPSIPFLKQLDVSFKPGQMFIGKTLGPNDLKEPFPGVRVSEASLGLQLAPEFKPEGKVVFQFGPKGKPPLADATLAVSTDGTGLVAEGKLRVFIPGVDKAEADVTYKGGGDYGAGSWSGTITIESSQIKLPYIESGSLIVQLAPGKGVDVDGKLNLNLPGDNTATVGLKRTERAWLLTGAGKFKVPKVGPVTVIVVYNTSTQHLSVEAKDIEFKIFGFIANLKTLTGEVQPGHNPVFYGSGSVDMKKGKVDGHAELTLNKNEKFTGKGTVKYKFNENLTATASVELDDKERLKFSGEIVIASIKLFEKFGDDKELFSVDLSIPIPGANIGGIGLEARIGGGAKMGYSIGPGTIAPLKFEAGFYPLEEQTDLNLGVSGSLNIPASAYLEANVHADIVLDALIAEIGGGVKVTGTITLQGGLFAPFSATFKQGKIEAELTPELKFALLLGLALSIRAWAKAGVGWLSVKTEKEWTLAKREINTGLGFSIIAPFKYSSDKGPQLPSLGDIKFKKPEITRDKMMSILDQLVSGASEKEV
jgi:hypothetical protein